MLKEKIKIIKKIIQESDAVLITAGAGMGVDSGLPDFRGNYGFWKEYPAIHSLGIDFEDMANPKWFKTNPQLAWAFYGHRLNLYRNVNPHLGFKKLLELVTKKNDNYFICTSNVDGQFQKAGFSKNKIFEMHGSIHHFQCLKNCTNEIWDADSAPIRIDMENFIAQDIPKCHNCQGVARPNILMFGDWSWIGNRSDLQEDSFYNWLDSIKNSNKKLVIIEIGAGIAIPTIRKLGERIAKKNKYSLIRINPRDFYTHESIGFSVPTGGLEGLDKIL